MATKDRYRVKRKVLFYRDNSPIYKYIIMKPGIQDCRCEPEEEEEEDRSPFVYICSS